MARETGAILSLSCLGRGVLTPPRRRAFWPGGGPSCTLPDRRETAIFQRRCPALLRASHLFGLALENEPEEGRSGERRNLNRLRHVCPHSETLWDSGEGHLALAISAWEAERNPGLALSFGYRVSEFGSRRAF